MLPSHTSLSRLTLTLPSHTSLSRFPLTLPLHTSLSHFPHTPPSHASLSRFPFQHGAWVWVPMVTSGGQPRRNLERARSISRPAVTSCHQLSRASRSSQGWNCKGHIVAFNTLCGASQRQTRAATWWKSRVLFGFCCMSRGS